MGIIARKGSWYSYGERRLAQGREKTLALVQEDTELLKCVGSCGLHPDVDLPSGYPVHLDRRVHGTAELDMFDALAGRKHVLWQLCRSVDQC